MILQAEHRAETPETKMLEIVAKRQFGGHLERNLNRLQYSVVCRNIFLAAEKAHFLNAPVLHEQITVFIRY